MEAGNPRTTWRPGYPESWVLGRSCFFDTPSRVQSLFSHLHPPKHRLNICKLTCCSKTTSSRIAFSWLVSSHKSRNCISYGFLLLFAWHPRAGHTALCLLGSFTSTYWNVLHVSLCAACCLPGRCHRHADHLQSIQ